MVRDIVNRQLVAHFRAHTSPLLALQFDPSGTILVTASLHGHNVHIFHICPWQGTGSGRGSGSARPLASAVHLYRLARGVTPAVIRDLSFSRDGAWLAVSSARGTTHIFRCVACMLLHKPRTFSCICAHLVDPSSCVTPLFVYPSLLASCTMKAPPSAYPGELVHFTLLCNHSLMHHGSSIPYTHFLLHLSCTNPV